MVNITAQDAVAFRADGVVCIQDALSAGELSECRRGFEWSLAHPTKSACEFYPNEPGRFYQDLCHPEAAFAYRNVLENSPVADIVASLWQREAVWFLYEQVFLKEGGAMRRTPWHQDSPYLALNGDELAVMWINFDPVAQSQSLEFVRGSHRGPLYNGSAFDETDDTSPIYGHGLPRLPDIEADRSAWDSVSFEVNPGDVVVFHPAMLHGGAPTTTARRRTLSLRFFGEEAVYAARPDPAPAPLTAGLHDCLKPGDRFRHPAFPRLRPSPEGFDEIPRDDGHGRSLASQIGAEAGG
jgi:ectoine hydroxylase-related dioxygenase (phytanoyl-CoA dioxygenase family)